MSDAKHSGMHGKICLVTGASSGIGKEAAIAIARMGATVVCVSRDAVRGEAALQDIRRESGNANVTLILGDLGVQRDVRRVAAEFRSHHAKLHVLVNNAGAAFGDRQLTEDGIERTFALNHMGYFLLTELLLDLLVASAPARIVNVASEGHRRGEIHFDDLNLEHHWGVAGTMVAYGQSKLANVLFTAELARRLEGTGVTVNCLHPGVVATNIWFANESLGGKLIGWLGKPFMVSPIQGAETIVYLATDPAVPENGKYFVKKRPVKAAHAGRDADLARRLWEVSAGLIRQVQA